MPVKNINAKELRGLIKNNKDDLEIIDVREPWEFEEIHIEGSKLIPMGELMERMDEVGWNKEVVFVCRSGSRSYVVAEQVFSLGKNVKNLDFGILGLQEDGEEFLIEDK